MPSFTSTPGLYRGPVPMVVHLHGGHTRPESDGYPEAWYLPQAVDIPPGYARVGSFYDEFRAAFRSRHGIGWAPGTATVQYDNDQRATTEWFHDHTLGMTRQNVYAGPYIPVTDVPPIWHPEVFGDTMVVNGRTWPVLPVRRRRYRFRLLNGCNSRFLMLKVVTNPGASRPAPAALPIWQIGSDGGFLPAPVRHSAVLMSPAQRVDAIVDFSAVSVGTELYLINEGPDEPFAGGTSGSGFRAGGSGDDRPGDEVRGRAEQRW